MQGFEGGAPIQVSDEVIRMSCQSLDDALRLCLAVSGRGMKEIAWDCGWRDEGRVLKRILCRSNTSDDRRYLPHEKWLPFMVACRNAVPLRYLTLQLFPDVLEDRRHEHDDLREEMAALRAMLTELGEEIRGKRQGPGGTSFSVAQGGVPVWLVEEVDRVALGLIGGE